MTNQVNRSSLSEDSNEGLVPAAELRRLEAALASEREKLAGLKEIHREQEKDRQKLRAALEEAREELDRYGSSPVHVKHALDILTEEGKTE